VPTPTAANTRPERAQLGDDPALRALRACPWRECRCPRPPGRRSLLRRPANPPALFPCTRDPLSEGVT